MGGGGIVFFSCGAGGPDGLKNCKQAGKKYAQNHFESFPHLRIKIAGIRMGSVLKSQPRTPNQSGDITT